MHAVKTPEENYFINQVCISKILHLESKGQCCFVDVQYNCVFVKMHLMRAVISNDILVYFLYSGVHHTGVMVGRRLLLFINASLLW